MPDTNFDGRASGLRRARRPAH